jgi:hypothetical protein
MNHSCCFDASREVQNPDQCFAPAEECTGSKAWWCRHQGLVVDTQDRGMLCWWLSDSAYGTAAAEKRDSSLDAGLTLSSSLRHSLGSRLRLATTSSRSLSQRLGSSLGVAAAACRSRSNGLSHCLGVARGQGLRLGLSRGRGRQGRTGRRGWGRRWSSGGQDVGACPCLPQVAGSSSGAWLGGIAAHQGRNNAHKRVRVGWSTRVKGV